MYVTVNTTATAVASSQLMLGLEDSVFAVAPDRSRMYLHSPWTRAEYTLPAGHHVNSHVLTAVYLIRDKSGGHLIPYNEIQAFTLIAVLRLGLVRELKERAYRLFVGLPLYEDMAPWNIVFVGPRLDYIDYDTRDKTFDAHVKKVSSHAKAGIWNRQSALLTFVWDYPQVYQIMSVLMNYKRTVKDFEKCGDKGSNPYGFSLVSECVGKKFAGPCEDPELPVPCGDGQCHSDYISCLRSMIEVDEPVLLSSQSPAEPAARQSGGGMTWEFSREGVVGGSV